MGMRFPYLKVVDGVVLVSNFSLNLRTNVIEAAIAYCKTEKGFDTDKWVDKGEGYFILKANGIEGLDAVYNYLTNAYNYTRSDEYHHLVSYIGFGMMDDRPMLAQLIAGLSYAIMQNRDFSAS